MYAMLEWMVDYPEALELEFTVAYSVVPLHLIPIIIISIFLVSLWFMCNIRHPRKKKTAANLRP